MWWKVENKEKLNTAYTKQSKKNIWQNYFVGKADQMRPESSLLIHLQCQNHGDAYPATTAELAVTRQRRRPATCTALIGPPYHESEEGRGAKRTTTRRIVDAGGEAKRRYSTQRPRRAPPAGDGDGERCGPEPPTTSRRSPWRSSASCRRLYPAPFLPAFRFLPPLIVSFFHWFPGGLGWFVLVVSWPVSVDYWAFLGHLFGFFAINFGLEWGRCFFCLDLFFLNQWFFSRLLFCWEFSVLKNIRFWFVFHVSVREIWACFVIPEFPLFEWR